MRTIYKNNEVCPFFNCRHLNGGLI
jgi:hypothetical protein